MEIEQLRGATVRELRAKYCAMFGQPSRSNHKQFLFRRIAWRLQAVAYGELSERARQRALAVAQDVDLRIKAPAYLVGAAQQVLQPTLRSRRKSSRDERLPEPGSVDCLRDRTSTSSCSRSRAIGCPLRWPSA